MTETKKFTLLSLQDGREARVGCNMMVGPCYICGQQVQEAYAVPGCQLAYHLCPDHNHEHLNVQLAINARYGFVHMHSWNGLPVQIKRSSGTIQAATVADLQMHEGRVYARCTWMESGQQKHRLFTYDSLIDLNSNLPELRCLNPFRGIPIDVSYQEKTNAWIAAMKTGQALENP